MSFLVTYLRRNHLALLALFVALGGTTYAAIALPKGSVGSKQLKAHSVTPSKVARSTVAMFRGQTGAPGRAGLTGPKGDPGPQGLKGDTGLQGPLGPTFATSASGTPPPFYNACTVVPFVSKTFTLARPGMLYIAPAGAGAYANGNSNTSVQYDVQLRNSADTTTLSDISTASYMNWSSNMPAAPLPDGAIMPASDGSPYLAAPGTYIARLTADVGGSCTPTNLTTFGSTHLSIIEIGGTG